MPSAPFSATPARVLVTVVCVIACGLPPSVGEASAGDEARGEAATDARAKATALLREGARQMDAGRTDDALKSFQEAYRLVPSPKVLFNLGVAYLQLSRNAEALIAFEGFLQQATDAPLSSLTTARRHVVELRPKVAIVELQSDRPTGTINLDGRDLGPMPFDRVLTVDPGHHVVRARVGDQSVERQVDVAAGQKATVMLAFDPAPLVIGSPAAAAPAGSVPAANPPGALSAAPALVAIPPSLSASSSSSTSEGSSVVGRPLYRRPWFWIATGGAVGVVALVLALSLGSTEYPVADRVILVPR